MAMTQNPLNIIKDRIYEAEGLLELLHLRPEKLPELAPMILSRLDEARSDFENFAKENTSQDDVPDSEEVTDTEEVSIPRAPRPRPAFCLNDRYRYRRAIFGGSDAEMNTTLDFIASMDSYGQAEEFFLTDMDLDKEDEDVADFLNIIRNYFGE